MNPSVLDTSSRFLQAAASYFGIPPDQIIMGKQGGSITGVFEVQLTIALTPGDLVGITHRMGQMAQPEVQEQQNPVFVPDDLNLEQLRDDYAALTQAERGKYGSFARYKSMRQLQKAIADREAEQFEADGLPGQWVGGDPVLRDAVMLMAQQDAQASEGVGGRKVQHVDVAEEQEAVSELPAAVWVPSREVNDAQVKLASDSDVMRRGYLLQVTLLTPEQKAKYCGEQKP